MNVLQGRRVASPRSRRRPDAEGGGMKVIQGRRAESPRSRRRTDAEEGGMSRFRFRGGRHSLVCGAARTPRGVA